MQQNISSIVNDVAITWPIEGDAADNVRWFGTPQGILSPMIHPSGWK